MNLLYRKRHDIYIFDGGLNIQKPYQALNHKMMDLVVITQVAQIIYIVYFRLFYIPTMNITIK
jgi:hypothetical protein